MPNPDEKDIVDETAAVVERLRERAAIARGEKTGTALGDAIHFEEAADEIERLRAQVDALQASAAGQVPDGYVLVPKAAIRWLLAERDEAIAAARAALQSSPQPTAGGDAPTSQEAQPTTTEGGGENG